MFPRNFLENFSGILTKNLFENIFSTPNSSIQNQNRAVKLNNFETKNSIYQTRESKLEKPKNAKQLKPISPQSIKRTLKECRRNSWIHRSHSGAFGRSTQQQPCPPLP